MRGSRYRGTLTVTACLRLKKPRINVRNVNDLTLHASSNLQLKALLLSWGLELV